MDDNDLYRLFLKSHTPLTPEETLDGEPDECVALMRGFARSLHRFGSEVISNCPPNTERDICIRKLYEALIYADLSLMLGNYDEDLR
jgi:hypothetical protein